MRRNVVIRNFICMICILFFFSTGYSQSATEFDGKSIDCRQATLTKPGIGNAFRGTIVNHGYAFSAKVPDGLTGWSGVDQYAPFHGFTIFLDTQMCACINFEIHIRIDEDDALIPPRFAKPIQMGNVQAWQYKVGEFDLNEQFINVHTLFSIKHHNRIDEGEIILIAPRAKFLETKRAYDAFIHSIKFNNL